MLVMYCMQFVMPVSVVFMVSWCGVVVFLGAMYMLAMVMSLYVCVLCASCGSSQCCVLHDLQFVNAGRGCNRRPYRRGIFQSRSHNCFIGSHECLLLFTPSCYSECFYDL